MPRPQVPVRRKSTIRYSDKKGVAQFREFADKLYTKRRVHERMNELIGGLALDGELAAAGLREVNDEERRGWSAVHWRAAGWPDIGLRGSEAGSTRRAVSWMKQRARRTRSSCARSATQRAPVTSRTRTASAKASAPGPSLPLCTAHGCGCSSSSFGGPSGRRRHGCATSSLAKACGWPRSQRTTTCASSP